MTTLIQQKTGNDCVLAAIAMAAGKERWEDLWTEEDLQSVVASKGISDWEPWMVRAGLGKEYVGWWEVHTSHIDDGHVSIMLWKRRALLSVNSLNNNGGHHAVYWDGDKVYDPHTGHEDQGYIAFKWLSSIRITRVLLLAGGCP